MMRSFKSIDIEKKSKGVDEEENLKDFKEVGLLGWKL